MKTDKRLDCNCGKQHHYNPPLNGSQRYNGPIWMGMGSWSKEYATHLINSDDDRKDIIVRCRHCAEILYHDDSTLLKKNHE